MTGKQRVEHTRWKQEQDKYDQERRERAKNAQGDWKREWDSDKPATAGGQERQVSCCCQLTYP